MRCLRQTAVLVALIFSMTAAFSQTDEQPPVPADLKKFVIGDPPQASARVTFPSGSKLLRKTTLGGAAQALSEALNARGYADQKWFVVSHDGGTFLEGIAVMTRLERIDDSAKSVSTDRFSQEPFTPEIKSLTEYFQRLLSKSSKGRYRSFFFYLTFRPSPRQQAPPQVGEMNSVFFSGASGGPAFEKMKIALPLACTAYVYEFERKAADGRAAFINNDAMSGQQHLVAADLWNQLGPE